MIDANDPTSLHMRRYHDGRVTAFVNGKELGAPDYVIEVEQWKRPEILNFYGEPTLIIGVRVIDARNGEVVASMHARNAELRPDKGEG